MRRHLPFCRSYGVLQLNKIFQFVSHLTVVFLESKLHLARKPGNNDNTIDSRVLKQIIEPYQEVKKRTS